MHRYPKHSKSEVVSKASELEKSVKGENPNHSVHLASKVAADNSQSVYPSEGSSVDQSGRVPEKSPK
jgi:hypothetical protein